MILVTVSSFKAFTSLKCSGTVVLIRINPRSDGNRYGSCRKFRWIAKRMSSLKITRQRDAAVERHTARAKALAHPLRFRIFAVLSHREASPAELAEELEVDLQRVAYHVRYLAGILDHSSEPLIELVDTDQRRGGTQHFYRIIGRQRVDIETSETLPQAVREDLSMVAVDRIVADLLGAQLDGTLDSHPQRSLMQISGRVDDEGMYRLAELVEKHVTAVEEVLAESERRIGDSEKPDIPIVSGTLVFPVSRVY